MMLALPRAAPRRAAARPAASRSICGTFIGGPHPDTGRHFTIVEPQVGRLGRLGRARRQQRDLQRLPRRHVQLPGRGGRGPLRALRRAAARSTTRRAARASTAAGKGIVLEYRVRADGCFFTCAYTRNKHQPWPLDGGREGSPNYAEVIRADGTVEEYAVVTALTVNEGDVIRIHTGDRRRVRRPARAARASSCSTTCATASSPGERHARSTGSTSDARSDDCRPVHARDHPELAAGDQRRDVRRAAQDGDERDHLRGARHGHRHHRRRGQPRVVGRRDPVVRRRARQGGEADPRAEPEPARSEPGDVFVTNDPFYGGVTHLNDVVLAMPVFADGELVAWTANIAHWNDVGGMVPGSISTEATRDLPGGPAAAGGEADRRQGEPIRSVIEIMK